MRNPMLGHDTARNRAANANQIWEARQRARQEVVDTYETIDDPRNIGIDNNGGSPRPSQSFLDWAEPQEIAHEFDQDIPEYDVQPADVHETGDGWGLTPGAERRVAAAEFEVETPLESVHPEDDIRETDDGFELRGSVLESNESLFY